MRYVLLLRGINLGATRRVSMPELRDTLEAAGLGPARTYVQSGNIVLDADSAGEDLEASVARLIAERFGLEVPVVVRTAEQIAEVVGLDPLGDVASDPRRYQVSFCAAPPAPELVRQLETVAAGEERVVAHGREIYAWHPDGVARSKLWNALAGAGLGTKATTRNWTTVTTLHRMAQEPAA
jgi:uncharacterized protein (DUF1697 family)